MILIKYLQISKILLNISKYYKLVYIIKYKLYLYLYKYYQK